MNMKRVMLNILLFLHVLYKGVKKCVALLI